MSGSMGIRLREETERALNTFLLLLAKCVRTLASPRARNRGSILLVRLDSIGDFVLFTSVLHSYRQLFKSSELILLVASDVAELAMGCPHVDAVWTLDRRKFRRNLLCRLAWWKRLWSYSFAVAIDTVYSTNFYAFECLVGWTLAGRRIGYQCLDPGPRRRQLWPNFTELVPTQEKWKFEIDRHIDLLEYLGDHRKEPKRPALWIGEEDRAGARATLKEVWDTSFAVVLPSSRTPLKRWPVELFAQTILQVQRRYPIVWVVCGAKDERSVAQGVVDRVSGYGIVCRNLAGETSLREFAALCERAVCTFGNDTGGIHISACLGTPTICILGGGQHGRFYPYPGNPNTIAVVHELPCFHCNWCCIFHEVECIVRIPVLDVANALKSVLSERGVNDMLSA